MQFNFHLYSLYHTGQSIPREKIGIVKVNVGLYLFNSLSVSSHSIPQTFDSFINYNIKDNKLWHYRLGHPTHERLHVLSKQYPFITINKMHICDTCNHVKQKTNLFL